MTLRRVLAACTGLVAAAACGGCGDESSGSCSGVDCSGHGVCLAVADGRYCLCAAGFAPQGDACVRPDGGDLCAVIACEGHGTCRLEGDSARCDCEPGWAELVDGHCVRVPPDGGPDDGRDGVGGDGDADAPGEGEAGADGDGDADADGTSPPRCGNGEVEAGEDCDDGNTADGDGCEGDCRYTCPCALGTACAACDDGNDCTDDRCVAAGVGRLCDNVPHSGAACDNGTFCDGPDSCDGSGRCVADGRSPCDDPVCWTCDEGGDACVPQPEDTVCRAAVGACDLAETCGSAHACPADAVEAAGVECRSGGDPFCDPAEACDGAAADCPSDYREPFGTSCDDGDPCTEPDSCNALGFCRPGRYICPP
jgi:cysteine-rich repeat protein